MQQGYPNTDSSCLPQYGNRSHQHLFLVNGGHTYTLLQMAKAWVSEKGNTKYLEICIVFDNCSQQTFITEHLRDKLGANTLRKENIMVKPFGSTEFKLPSVDIVSLRVCRRINMVVSKLV